MPDENQVGQKEEAGLSEVLALLKSIDSRISALELAEEGEVEHDADNMPAPELPASGEPAAQDADNAKPSEEIAHLQKRIDGIESKLEAPAEDEQNKLAEAQAKADAVAQAFGDSAPRALQGEGLLAYRKRLASKFQSHSKAYAGVKLTAIADSALFDAVESAIYADALEVAKKPATVPAGQLFERVRTDSTGRRISEFEGKPSVWMNQFKSPSSMVTGIKTQFN